MVDSLRSINVTFHSKKSDSSGQWVDKLTAKAEVKKSADKLDINITQDVEERNGFRVIILRIICKDLSVPCTHNKDEGRGVNIAEAQTGISMDHSSNQNIAVQTEQRIVSEMDSLDEETQTDMESTKSFASITDLKIYDNKFHEKCGSNVKIDIRGMMVRHLKREDRAYSLYTCAFTKRRLNNREIFRIGIKEVWKRGHYLSIGVIDKSPNDVQIEGWMILSKRAWVYWGKSIYINGELKNNENYGEGTNAYKIGKTLGVMRDEDGNLYFLVNGINQGLAARGVPTEIYGFVELGCGASRVSIVTC